MREWELESTEICLGVSSRLKFSSLKNFFITKKIEHIFQKINFLNISYFSEYFFLIYNRKYYTRIEGSKGYINL